MKRRIVITGLILFVLFSAVLAATKR